MKIPTIENAGYTSPIKRIKIKIKNDCYIEDVDGCSYEEIADRVYSKIQEEDTILRRFSDGLVSVLLIKIGWNNYEEDTN